MSNKLASGHPIFHVSKLKKCVGDPTSIIVLERLVIDEIHSDKDILVEILDQQVEKLRNIFRERVLVKSVN